MNRKVRKKSGYRLVGRKLLDPTKRLSPDDEAWLGGELGLTDPIETALASCIAAHLNEPAANGKHVIAWSVDELEKIDPTLAKVMKKMIDRGFIRLRYA